MKLAEVSSQGVSVWVFAWFTGFIEQNPERRLGERTRKALGKGEPELWRESMYHCPHSTFALKSSYDPSQFWRPLLPAER